MKTTHHTIAPPSLEELAAVLTSALQSNYKSSQASVEQCPDLRNAPYNLATEGLSGNESVADIGGQPNLFPEPRLDCKFSLPEIAREMQMSPNQGHLLGAGAGPFHVIGMNSELAPNLSWRDGFKNLTNRTYYAKIDSDTKKPVLERSPCADCALMMNLYGSEGKPGPVLKITARGRKGSFKSFTECIRQTLAQHYGDSTPVSMGGVFVIRQGKARFHIMPDFPPQEEMPFKNAKQLNDWLTYHDFEAPIVCLTVFHSVDPRRELGLRIEHTHCFSEDGGNRGGHYHYDLDEDAGGEVEYEAYFNTAKVIHRIDKPVVTLERDLHD